MPGKGDFMVRFYFFEFKYTGKRQVRPAKLTFFSHFGCHFGTSNPTPSAIFSEKNTLRPTGNIFAIPKP